MWKATFKYCHCSQQVVKLLGLITVTWDWTEQRAWKHCCMLARPANCFLLKKLDQHHNGFCLFLLINYKGSPAKTQYAKDFSGSSEGKKTQECNFLFICQVKCKLRAQPTSAAWMVCVSQANCHTLPNDWQAWKWTTKTISHWWINMFGASKTINHWTQITSRVSAWTSHWKTAVWKATWKRTYR